MCRILLSFLHIIYIHTSYSPTHINFLLSPFIQAKPSESKTMGLSLCFGPFSLYFLILVFSVLNISIHASDPPLTLDYYASTCPTVFDVIRKETECAVLSDPRNAALIVRLHFHDCFVQVPYIWFKFLHFMKFCSYPR